MKLFVAGHSDSGTAWLPDGVLPWADRTRAWVEQATGEPCELSGVRFAPMGSRAVDYLLGAVEKAAPDVVVIPFTAYVCTVGTVGESVRARFGRRAQSWFRKTEAGFERRTRHMRGGRPANTLARRAARTVFGSRSLATVEESASIYEEVLHRLAQIESLQVIAIADARFSKETQRQNPGIHKKIDALYARVMPVAEQHHFFTADLEGALRRAPDRSVFYHPDGVHTTAAFHEVYFGVMQEAMTAVMERAAKA